LGIENEKQRLVMEAGNLICHPMDVIDDVAFW